MHVARHRALHALPLWVAAAGAYFGFARLSASAPFAHDGAPLILLAQGVAYAAVQLGGPWLAAAVAAGAMGEGVAEGRPLGGVLLLGVAAAGAGLAAYVVTDVLRLRLAEDERLGDTLIRFGGAVAASVAGASFYFAADAVEHAVSRPPQQLGSLFLANLAGIVVVAPFLRVWFQRTSRGAAGRIEWGGLVAVAVGMSFVVDTGVLGASGPTGYLLFPVVGWAALRAGRMGVSAVVLLSALVAVGYTSDHRGPFIGATFFDSTIAVDSFLVVLALTGLLLVALEQERRQTESGLTAAEERHRELIERLPLVTYERGLDLDAPPSFQSNQAVEILGYPMERWLSEPRFASRLVHPDDREINAELNERSLVEDVVQGEYRMIRADGRVVWVLDHMSVVRDAAGKAVRQQGFVVDISERKALEEQLVRAQRLEALGLLAGGIAHDFNNLLTAISGYTGLALEHGGRANEEIRRDLDEVRTAAARAAELTRQLLAFGRRQVLARTVVDLNEVVIEAQALLDRVLGEHIRIETRLEPNLVRIEADGGQLGHVLVNLAVNARDAMPEGGTLTIETANEGGNATLTVSDTGHGMDEPTRARIFEPFFTTKGVGEGSGLGLAMVHGIVLQSEGDITVSSSPGRGATFRLVFPGTTAEPTERAVPTQSSPRGSETILLVEDEDIVRRLVAEMLEGQGYTVLTADGPTAALEITEPFDLLLTDVVMPTMSGPELAARLTQRMDIAVLFTSGYSGAAFADRDPLAADLLEKPFTIEQLASKVRQALDARSPALPLR